MAKNKAYLTGRIKEKLNRISQAPLTFLSAPVGYGKTTVLREYLLGEAVEKSDCQQVLWRNLLGGGSQGFWEDFRSLFKKEDEEFYQYLSGIAMPDCPGDFRTFLDRFLELCHESPLPLILVLDGLEEHVYGEIQEFLHFFVKNMPEGIHLVMTGRDAEVQYDEFLQIYDLVNLICQEDFNYSLRDMEQYYRLNGVVAASRDIQALYGTCAGWNVLIHLNLREFQEHKSFLSEHEMFGLIERIVFKRVPEQVVDFLSTVAAAGTFTEEAAEYLWKEGNAAELLNQLKQEGQFLKVDRASGKYRLFPVFERYIAWKNEYLSEEERTNRANRLAEWYLKNDENALARGLYYRIKNFDALMDAVERRRFIVLYGLDEQEFISYYTDCPAEIRARHPKAILTFARQMFAFGHHEMGKEVCAEFEEIMRQNTEMDQETQTRLEGTYELLLCYAQYNDLSAMLLHIYEAKRMLDNRRVAIVWPDTGLNDSLSLLYMYHRKSGNLEQETKLFSEYNPIYSSLIGGRLDGAELVMQAETFYVTGRLQEAEIVIYKSLLAIHRDKQWHTWLCVVLLQIRIALTRGKWSSVEYFLREVTESVSLKKEYRVFPVTDMLEIFVYSKLGRPEKIRAQFDANASSQFMLCFRAAPMLYCVQAEALLAKGEYLKLLAMSENYLKAARVYPNVYAELMLQVILAGAYEAMENWEEAKYHMHTALSLALPDSIIMPFVELSRYVRQTLDLLANEESYPELKEIRKRAEEYGQSVQQVVSEHFTQSPMGLTAREREIAELASKRLSNKEIADRLVISESTVKTQLTRAFSKLEIQKRRELNRFFPEK